MHGCSRRSARQGGRGEGEDTDGMMDRARHFREIWGAWGEDMGGRLPLLAGAELVLVGWCGGGNRWLWRIWKLLAGAEVGFICGRGAGTCWWLQSC